MNTEVTMEGINIPSMKTLGIDTAADLAAGATFDGILGMAPKPQDPDAELLVDKLKDAGGISKAIFSTYYRLNPTDSWIDFGGWSTEIVKNETNIKWIDLKDTQYWSLPLEAIYYGTKELKRGSSVKRGIIDTGTSLTHLDGTTYDNWLKELKASKNDCGYKFSGSYDACFCDGEDDFPDLVFEMGGYKLNVIPNEYIVTATQAGTGKKFCYFLVGNLGTSGIGANSLLLGDSFMRNFYIIHDQEDDKAGFYAYDGRNIEGDGLSDSSVIALIVVLVIVGVCLVCSVAIVTTLVICLCKMSKAGAAKGGSSAVASSNYANPAPQAYQSNPAAYQNNQMPPAPNSQPPVYNLQPMHQQQPMTQAQYGQPVYEQQPGVYAPQEVPTGALPILPPVAPNQP